MKVSQSYPQAPHTVIPKPDMQVVVEAHNIPLRKMGNKLVGKCCFHSDDTPSFVVYERHAHCYGCGWHGDGVDFVAKIKNISLSDAISFVREHYQETTSDAWPTD